MAKGKDVTEPSSPKILHVILSMSVGGAETLVYNMVRHHSFSGNRPVICCLKSSGELGDKLKEEGYTVYNHSSGAGTDWSLIGWIRDIILTEKIDVVHAHQYPPFFYAVPAAFLAGRVKFVYTEHGRNYPDVRRWKRYLLNPFLASMAGHLVSISSSTARAMADMDNLPFDRIQIIHNGVDFSRMNPPINLAEKRLELGIGEACRIIGTAARLEEIKNIPMMLRGFKQIHAEKPDTCLMIAGQGSQEANLKALVSELGIDNHVRFIGLRHDMPEIYKLMDVFLLTSFTEGISVTLLESMASGVPGVVTDVGGNPEVVIDKDTGYLVPLGNDGQLADRVIDLLSDRSLAEKMGCSAQKRAVEHFSFDTMMASYRHLYE
ncbi:putative glycosyltransferase YpjH [Geobacter sp. OR-1]|uniref:glycosyltransferase n=1 Tax=Geobacter sp. OR-1 TaxID=1266765 RepID=UPI0005427445|nr:glycosyltransferase [Geobacter sp. OR-1]GAM10586.1 putative glycosyltransferase YpjH [Geobacter sp. OR-1]